MEERNLWWSLDQITELLALCSRIDDVALRQVFHDYLGDILVRLIEGSTYSLGSEQQTTAARESRQKYPVGFWKE